jgi:hypothetical protein
MHNKLHTNWRNFDHSMHNKPMRQCEVRLGWAGKRGGKGKMRARPLAGRHPQRFAAE